MGRAICKPLLNELLDGIPTRQDAVQYIDSYLDVRKTIHLKGIAHNDMHVLNFFYDKKTKKGMVIDFGLSKNDSKAALIEALGFGTSKDWQSKSLIQDIELIGTPGFLRKDSKKYKKFNLNRIKVRNLLRKELDGPELIYREIRGRTDNLPGISDAKALKFLEMLYEGI